MRSRRAHLDHSSVRSTPFFFSWRASFLLHAPLSPFSHNLPGEQAPPMQSRPTPAPVTPRTKKKRTGAKAGRPRGRREARRVFCAPHPFESLPAPPAPRPALTPATAHPTPAVGPHTPPPSRPPCLTASNTWTRTRAVRVLCVLNGRCQRARSKKWERGRRRGADRVLAHPPPFSTPRGWPDPIGGHGACSTAQQTDRAAARSRALFFFPHHFPPLTCTSSLLPHPPQAAPQPPPPPLTRPWPPPWWS